MEEYDLSYERGFLPKVNPSRSFLQSYKQKDVFDACERLLDDSKKISDLLLTGEIRNFIDKQDISTYSATTELSYERDIKLAAMLLSFLAHAYIWGGNKPATKLPVSISFPWVTLHQSKLGRPPIQSYASYALDNWYKLDIDKEICLENISTIQQFLGGQDEKWFVTIHVVIEGQAGKALASMYNAIEAKAENDWEAVNKHLYLVAQGLKDMYNTLCRMEEKCDPYIYYNRVRPYLFGSKDNSNLPEGLLYDEMFEGQPQKYRGETGAQSSIIPALDGGLGIYHEESKLKIYLLEMREYMPPKHRAFIEFCEKNGNIKEHVKDKDLEEPFNQCIDLMYDFRTKHMEFAQKFIQQQEKKSSKTEGIGTGGTPFIKYLGKHKRETLETKEKNEKKDNGTSVS